MVHQALACSTATCCDQEWCVRLLTSTLQVLKVMPCWQPFAHTNINHSCWPTTAPHAKPICMPAYAHQPAHLCVWEVIPGWAYAHVDLAGQVCKLLIAAAVVEQHTVHLMQDGPVLAGKWAAGQHSAGSSRVSGAFAVQQVWHWKACDAGTALSVGSTFMHNTSAALHRAVCSLYRVNESPGPAAPAHITLSCGGNTAACC
jgi:hypothetical protein